MIDAYNETVEQTLQVEDVLNHLKPVLGNKEYIIIKRQANLSNSKALKILLEEIGSSEREGAWQEFINALEAADYKFLVTLLQGEQENNQAAARGLLDFVGPELLNKLHVRACVDTLFKREIILESDKVDVRDKEKQQGPIAATRLLLEKLPLKSNRFSPEIQNILKIYGLNEIAKIFQGCDEPSFTDCSIDETSQKVILKPTKLQPVQFLDPTNASPEDQLNVQTQRALTDVIMGLKLTTESLTQCLLSVNALLEKML